MSRYRTECPHSLESLKRSGAAMIEQSAISNTVKNILRLGTEINDILEALCRTLRRSACHKKNGLCCVYYFRSEVKKENT